jgi:PhnB protein
MTRQRPLGLGTHIFVPNADAAVAFYTEAFGAAELIRHRLPDGRVLFVELAVGPDKLLLSEEIAELNALAPSTLGGSPVMLLLELDDVDGTFDHAIEMGAAVEMPVAETFWGERYGIVRDPFGHHWALCTVGSSSLQTRSPSGSRPSQPTAPGPAIRWMFGCFTGGHPAALIVPRGHGWWGKVRPWRLRLVFARLVGNVPDSM